MKPCIQRSVYYFKPSWWVGNALCAIPFILGAIAMMDIEFYPFTNFFNWIFNIFGMLLIAFSMLLGIMLLLNTLTSKIVLSSQGFEYHFLPSVIKFRWEDISIRSVRKSSDGAVSFNVSKADICPRPWTRYVPWDVEKGVRYNLIHTGIPIEQFGKSDSISLIEAMQSFCHNPATLTPYSQD